MINNQKPVNIVGVPDYIVTALKSNNLTLQELDSIADSATTYEKAIRHYNDPRSKSMNKVQDMITAKLSVSDISDWITGHRIITEKLFVTYNDHYPRYNEVNLSNFFTNLEFHHTAPYDLIASSRILYDLYNDTEYKTNTNLVFLNNEDKAKQQICSFVAGPNTLFVILHKGFTNLMTSDKSKHLLRVHILNQVYTKFGETRSNNSNIVTAFLKNV